LAASLSTWALAQAGRISGSVKERSLDQGIQGVLVTVKDTGTGALAGIGTTDAAGRYSVGVRSWGTFTLAVSTLGYDASNAPDLVVLSESNPDLTLAVAMARNAWLEEPQPGKPLAPPWGTGAGRSHLVPALEIPLFLALLNGYDRLAYSDVVEPWGEKTYSTTWSTTRNHLLHGKWVIDRDAFAMNQFNHPYQGALFHGFARSAGVGYWESLLYDNMGAFLWKMGGETGNPSLNDMVTTGQAGSFLGEVLFRLANLVLEGDGDRPGFWRKLGATALSPSTGINMFGFGDRFSSVFPSHEPPTYWRLQVGESLSSVNDRGQSLSFNRNAATLDYSIAYGLPGKDGYTYTRPFDYFHFQFTTLGNRDNPVDDIMIRGLLLGTDYEAGDSYRGIWGLYGGYDYISPYIFRVSTTSLSLGTTYQWRPSPVVALQGSLLGGVGYGAAGNVTPVGERDYHYGLGPQALLALRLLLGEWAAFDLTGRKYYLNGSGGNDPSGREDVGRLNAGFTVRIHGRQSLGLQYLFSTRDARYPDRPDSHQSGRTVSLVYTLLGNSSFGVVK